MQSFRIFLGTLGTLGLLALAACNGEVAVLSGDADDADGGGLSGGGSSGASSGGASSGGSSGGGASSGGASSGGSSGAPMGDEIPLTDTLLRDANPERLGAACASADLDAYVAARRPAGCESGCVAAFPQSGSPRVVESPTESTQPQQAVLGTERGAYYLRERYDGDELWPYHELMRIGESDEAPSLIGSWKDAPGVTSQFLDAVGPPVGREHWADITWAYGSATESYIVGDGTGIGVFGPWSDWYNGHSRLVVPEDSWAYATTSSGIGYIQGDSYGALLQADHVEDFAVYGDTLVYVQAAWWLDPNISLVTRRGVWTAKIANHQIVEGSTRYLLTTESATSVAFDDSGALWLVDGRKVVVVEPDLTAGTVMWRGAALPQQPGLLGTHHLEVVGQRSTTVGVYFDEVCNGDADAPTYAPRHLSFGLASFDSSVSWRVDDAGYPYLDHLAPQVPSKPRRGVWKSGSTLFAVLPTL